jgi:Glycosyl hydrolases family 2, sugar binding domain
MPTTRQSLNGTWAFRFADQAEWDSMQVPGCWETPFGPKNRPGPALYRTLLVIPAGAHDLAIQLEFAAVSYACEVLIDGVVVGSHIGAWDAFSIDITNHVRAGQSYELLVVVEKPAALSAGPDSASLTGRYPLRGTLAGFLPYVWGQLFGGIWQDVTLVTRSAMKITELVVLGDANGQIQIELMLEGASADIHVIIADSSGRNCFSQNYWHDAATGAALQIRAELPSAIAWSPQHPALYTATVSYGDTTRAQRFALRTISVAGSDILLNGQPIYPRMILSWGWYEGHLDSNPGRERVRADMRKLQALGYNGIKLCLWFPPRYYFELADELGMLLWVELPMWIPQPDAHFRSQVPIEYRRLVRQAAEHPAVILYSLGCELNRQVEAELLAPLYEMVKQLGRGALVRDNSGSGEAYGGLLAEHADYYDYHFYADLQHFRGLLDHFTPRWRPVQPWVFGEFCDYDTLRDPERTAEAWWMSQDAAINPQGARWQFDTPWLASRMLANGLWDRRSELEALSYQHALLHRKYTLELVRAYREIGGYVITGEADTPISTAGMWNEHGVLKFAPDAFRAFNADLVVLVGWDRRRAWIDGGDRAAPYDPWCYRAGSLVRPHLIVSWYGQANTTAEQPRGNWQLLRADGSVLTSGTLIGPAMQPGELREIAVFEYHVPALSRPAQVELRVSITLGNQVAQNSWPLWFFPAALPSRIQPYLYDPANLLVGSERFFGFKTSVSQDGGGKQVHVCTAWSPAIEARVRAGDHAVLIEAGGVATGPLPLVALPFWREALRVCEDHPAWGDFPHAGWAALQFLACATDRTLEYDTIEGAKPILLRIDTRTMAKHAYIVDVPLGAGRVIITTLRLCGGLGEQPRSILASPAALWLLGCLMRAADQAQ